MGLFSFIKTAGEKIFGAGADAPEEKKEEVGSMQLMNHLKALNLGSEGVKVRLKGDQVILDGEVESQEAAEKVILAVGNVEGVGSVQSNLTVKKQAPEAKYYTVKEGDWLSKIAKEYYGDANKYTVIFEANKPMLKDPDKIYPGQVLRIPPLEQ